MTVKHPAFDSYEQLHKYIDETFPEDWGVHLTHCCPGHCKYGEVDVCPVATLKADPIYKCEDCTCLAMNPEAANDANKWWAALSDADKASVFLMFRM